MLETLFTWTGVAALLSIAGILATFWRERLAARREGRRERRTGTVVAGAIAVVAITAVIADYVGSRQSATAGRARDAAVDIALTDLRALIAAVQSSLDANVAALQALVRAGKVPATAVADLLAESRQMQAQNRELLERVGQHDGGAAGAAEVVGLRDEVKTLTGIVRDFERRLQARLDRASPKEAEAPREVLPPPAEVAPEPDAGAATPPSPAPPEDAVAAGIPPAIPSSPIVATPPRVAEAVTAPPPIVGTWDGMLDLPFGQVPFQVSISESVNGGFEATVESAVQDMFAVPARVLTVGTSVSVAPEGAPAVFTGELSGDQIPGTYASWRMTLQRGSASVRTEEQRRSAQLAFKPVFNGIQVYCQNYQGTQVPSVVTFEESTLAAARPSGDPTIRMNPTLLRDAAAAVQLFWFTRECAHHAMGPKTAAIVVASTPDCWAARTLRQLGLLSESGVAQLRSTNRTAPTALWPAAQWDKSADEVGRCYAEGQQSAREREAKPAGGLFVVPPPGPPAPPSNLRISS